MSAIELVRVSTPEDWEQYHSIREKVLFENKNRSYDRTHADEHRPNNVPFLLKKDGLGIATTRLDLRPDTQAAIIRLVAVVESEQRKGYGRALQAKIDEYARSQGVKRLLVNAAPDAIGFYKKIGFVPESWDPEELTGISKDSVQLSKALLPMTEKEILELIKNDEWMMSILRVARSLNLPDWIIGAGFVRNKVWDHLHGYTERTPLADIDLIYFDPAHIDESQEKEYDQRLHQLVDVQWSTKNQARMHVINGNAPFTSAEDGLAHWIETPTCTGVTLLDNDTLQLIAPYGIEDLVHLRVRPVNPEKDITLYRERVTKKKWKETWPRLEILETRA